MIRVGIVGMGFMGWVHWLSYQQMRGVRVAVGDVDPTPMSELIAVAGFGGLPRVRLASGANNVLVELRTFVSPNVP